LTRRLLERGAGDGSHLPRCPTGGTGVPTAGGGVITPQLPGAGPAPPGGTGAPQQPGAGPFKMPTSPSPGAVTCERLQGDTRGVYIQQHAIATKPFGFVHLPNERLFALPSFCDTIGRFRRPRRPFTKPHHVLFVSCQKPRAAPLATRSIVRTGANLQGHCFDPTSAMKKSSTRLRLMF
jgi:hypothetical protein